MDIKNLEKIVYDALTIKTKHYGLNPDKSGWIKTRDLVERVNFMNGIDDLNEDTIFQIVYNNPNYSTNLFRTKIKANKKATKKESYRTVIPPDILYYKSNKRYDISEAFIVTPCDGVKYLELTHEDNFTESAFVITVDTRTMFAAGYKFYTLNGKYYTEKLPSKFILKIRRVG